MRLAVILLSITLTGGSAMAGEEFSTMFAPSRETAQRYNTVSSLDIQSRENVNSTSIKIGLPPAVRADEFARPKMAAVTPAMDQKDGTLDFSEKSMEPQQDVFGIPGVMSPELLVMDQYVSSPPSPLLPGRNPLGSAPSRTNDLHGLSPETYANALEPLQPLPETTTAAPLPGRQSGFPIAETERQWQPASSPSQPSAAPNANIPATEHPESTFSLTGISLPPPPPPTPDGTARQETSRSVFPLSPVAKTDIPSTDKGESTGSAIPTDFSFKPPEAVQEAKPFSPDPGKAPTTPTTSKTDRLKPPEQAAMVVEDYGLGRSGPFTDPPLPPGMYF